MMRRWLLLVVIVVAVLALDQLTKQIVVDNLRVGESRVPIPALATFFRFTRGENTGSAFGFLPQASDIFLVIAVVVVGVMFIFYGRLPDRATLTRIGLSLVAGGALGNAADRLQHGAVVDFIHYQIPGVVSNVSNLADHAIVFGVILIFIDSWIADRQMKSSMSDPGETPVSDS